MNVCKFDKDYLSMVIQYKPCSHYYDKNGLGYNVIRILDPVNISKQEPLDRRIV